MPKKKKSPRTKGNKKPPQKKKSGQNVGAYLIGVLLALGLLGGGYALFLENGNSQEGQVARPGIAPQKTQNANVVSSTSAGKTLFKKNCMKCHGPEAKGSTEGPPLVHRYYEPNHHSDAAFHQAVRRGARQHHWRFGNMEPVPGVSPEEVGVIIRYVRNLQRKAGVY